MSKCGRIELTREERAAIKKIANKSVTGYLRWLRREIAGPKLYSIERGLGELDETFEEKTETWVFVARNRQEFEAKKLDKALQLRDICDGKSLNGRVWRTGDFR